jgi:hypothetical protein
MMLNAGIALIFAGFVLKLIRYGFIPRPKDAPSSILWPVTGRHYFHSLLLSAGLAGTGFVLFILALP